MSLFRTGLTVTTWAAGCALSASTSVAQPAPWVLFPDSLTLAACDVVNAENAELVVLLATGELVIVSGSDVIIDGSFVDIDAPGPPWLVFFFGDPVGFVDFAVDGDGLQPLVTDRFRGPDTQLEVESGIAKPLEPDSRGRFS